MNASNYQHAKMSLEFRIDNASENHVSDMRSVAMKITRIADMELTQYFELAPAAFAGLQQFIEIESQSTYAEAATKINTLTDQNREAGEKALWLLMRPLIMLSDLIFWGDVR